MTLLELARKLRYLREAGQNQGLRINGIQLWSGGQPGDSWCLEWIWFILDIFYEGAAPFERMQSVETFRRHAIAQGWQVATAEPGDLVVSVTDNHGHHIGLCTANTPLTTIAGNTSEDGVSSNGDRVAEHVVSPIGKEYFRLPPFVAKAA